MDGRKALSDSKPVVYLSRDGLLTPTECAFWQELNKVLPRDVMACPKVRVSDVVWAKTFQYGPKNRINQKHFDFVLIDALSGAILGAVELDDPSHDRADRREADRLKEEVLESAGIGLVRVNAAPSYSLDVLAAAIAPLLERRASRAA